MKPLMRAATVAARLGGAALLAAGVVLGGGCGGSSSSGHTTTASGGGAKAPPGPAAPSASGIVTATAGSIRASMHATTHRPRVGLAWPVRFTVTSAGRPARASVSYEFLLGGQVVARRSHYTFHGHFSDIVVWPASALGIPLTFRAVVVAGRSTVNLDYPVRVTR